MDIATETAKTSTHLQPILRRRAMDDSFFDLGNCIRQNAVKQMNYGNEEILHLAIDPVHKTKIECTFIGCQYRCGSFVEYDDHYQSAHQHQCRKCHHVFHSSRLLHIHFQEHHDTFFKVMAERQSMYECLVEGCDRKFQGPKQRRLHMIDLHKFPKAFFFQRSSDSSKAPKAKKTQPNGKENRMNLKKLNSTNDMVDDCAKGDQPQNSFRDPKVDRKKRKSKKVVDGANSLVHKIDAELMKEEDCATRDPCPSVMQLCDVATSCKISDGMEEIPTRASARVSALTNIRFGRGRGRGFYRPPS